MYMATEVVTCIVGQEMRKTVKCKALDNSLNLIDHVDDFFLWGKGGCSLTEIQLLLEYGSITTNFSSGRTFNKIH